MEINVSCQSGNSDGSRERKIFPVAGNPPERSPSVEVKIWRGDRMILYSLCARTFRLVNENGNVAPGGERNLNRMTSALIFVKLRQALSEPVRFDARDRIFCSIEHRLGTAKNFRCDVVFTKLVGFAGEELLSDIPEQL
jgi:hypothetical protein